MHSKWYAVDLWGKVELYGCIGCRVGDGWKLHPCLRRLLSHKVHISEHAYHILRTLWFHLTCLLFPLTPGVYKNIFCRNFTTSNEWTLLSNMKIYLNHQSWDSNPRFRGREFLSYSVQHHGALVKLGYDLNRLHAVP